MADPTEDDAAAWLMDESPAPSENAQDDFDPDADEAAAAVKAAEKKAARDAIEARRSEAAKIKARELWERLGRSRPGPDNKDLLFVARFVPSLASSAVKTLFQRELNVEELKELIQHVPKAQDAATKMLLKRPESEVTEEDLRFVATHTKSPEAARLLLKRFPNDAVLGFVERTIDGLQELVDKIRSREATRNVMREIERLL